MSRVSRRHFIAALSVAVPALSTTRVRARSTAFRALSFDHLHTGERLTIEYFSEGQYLTEALTVINHLLRDFRTTEVHAIDIGLLDLLHSLNALVESTRPYQVISGYRSPATNEMLRHRNEGVAAGSLHMKGQAIDVRLADVPLVQLRNAALSLGLGGVGFYPTSDFVHVDTGRVRAW
jgi:uncharacterized protein YcbK (DUF882 family)